MCRASGFFMLGSIFVLSKNKTLFLGFLLESDSRENAHLSEQHSQEVNEICPSFGGSYFGSEGVRRVHLSENALSEVVSGFDAVT